MNRATRCRTRRNQKLKMPKFQGEVFRDAQGREAVCFTTPSGVRAIVATEIPRAALDKLIAKLQRKLDRRKRSGPSNKA